MRFCGCLTPMVARLPSPIKASPSPVSTATRRVGLGERQAEADHGGAAHRAPEIEVERMIAAGGGIVSRRTEPGDDQQIAPVGQHLFHECAAIERRLIHHRLVHHLVHCLRPISRCDRMMATGRSPLNAMSHPAATTSSTSSGASTR